MIFLRLSRWWNHRFGSRKTDVDPKLIQMLPYVPEYRPKFTIREQLKGMEEAQLPTPEEAGRSVAEQGRIGTSIRGKVYISTLSDMTSPEQRRVLFLNDEAMPRFDDALRKHCREIGVSVSTTPDRSMGMKLTFRPNRFHRKNRDNAT